MAVIKKKEWFKAINHEPHPQQWLYHNSKARFRTPVCGRRFGKSVMAGRDLEPKLFDQGSSDVKKMFWIVGPTYDLGEKEFRVIWDDLMIGKGLAKMKGIKKSYSKNQGNMFIEFPWNTRLEVRSADRPDSLVGESLWHAIMSEAAKHKEETFERFIRPALADHRGGADFPTTPEGQNWLYKMWQLGQDPEHKLNFESWQFPSWMNPHVYPLGEIDPEIALLKLGMTEAEFQQEIAADFTSFAGRIFPQFQERTHVTDVPFDPALPSYIAFDFGYVNPLAAIWFQITPDERIRVWREYYHTGASTYENIQRIKAMPVPPGYRIDAAFGDAADPSSIADVSNHLVGCYGDPDSKDWKTGIDLLAEFIKLKCTGKVIDDIGTPAEDEPWMVVDRSAKEFIQEMNNYRAPKGTATRSPREVGNDIENHGIDAIRYGLMHIFKIGLHGSLTEFVNNMTDAYQQTESGLFIPEREKVSVNYNTPETRNDMFDFSDITGDETFFDMNNMEF